MWHLGHLPGPQLSNRLVGVKPPLRHGLRQLLRVRWEVPRRLLRMHLRPQVAILVSRVMVPSHRHHILARTHPQPRTTLRVDSQSHQCGLGRITCSTRRKRRRGTRTGNRIGVSKVGMRRRLGMTRTCDVQLVCSRPSATINLLGMSQYASVWPRAVQYSQFGETSTRMATRLYSKGWNCRSHSSSPAHWTKQVRCSRYMFSSPLIFSFLTLPRYRISRSCPQKPLSAPPLGPPSSSDRL